MKRTNKLTKLISVILFLFLLVYFGASFIRSVQNPLRTVPVVYAQAEEGFFAPGIILRDEMVVTAGYPAVASLVREGERVSVGMNYLLVYASEADRQLDVRRTQLENEIVQLEARLGVDGGLDQSAGIEAEIRTQLRDLSHAIHQGDLTNLEEQTISLRALALAGDREGIEQRIETLRTELSNVSSLSAPPRAIQADYAGVFSTRIDGFEYLGRQEIAGLSVQDVRELLDHRYTAEEIPPVAGKLVTGSTWYYVALVPEAEVDALQARLERRDWIPNRVTLSFAGMQTADVPMQVYALGEVEDGQAKAVFSSNFTLTEVLGLRHTSARIVYSTFAGLFIPQEALHWGEPHAETGARPAYVYTLTVGMAEQKFVVVLYAGYDYYLVRPDTARTSADASLREGNTLIIRARNIYDGRIFR